jgi:glycosyltransferase involved in cell wall biosynthesis
MTENLVSTVIPVYNRPSMLIDAVQSVLDQSWRPIEIIIVDDGSDDSTLDVAHDLASRNADVVRVSSQSNRGPGAARQAGYEMAHGEFIQFLDSDDLLLPAKFEIQVLGLRQDPDAGISYGKTHVEEGGVVLPRPAQRTGEKFRTLFPALLQEPVWPTLTPLYRRSTLEQIGPWPARRQLEDWVFDAQAAELGIKLHYCEDKYVAITRNHAGPRLCSLWLDDTDAMRDRVFAYETVLNHAQRAGLDLAGPDMQRFARSLFWMARTVGGAGLPIEAERLFTLARSISSGSQWDLKFFAGVRATLGWKLASRMAKKAELLRKPQEASLS